LFVIAATTARLRAFLPVRGKSKVSVGAAM
jgi:hypothetical protein